VVGGLSQRAVAVQSEMACIVLVQLVQIREGYLQGTEVDAY
jgi:hypothetical protein